MQMQMRTAATLVALLALPACKEETSGFTVGNTKDESACDLTIDSLADTEWLFLKANPDKSEEPDHHTRLKFFSEDGGLKAKYNVGSITGMYTYRCTKVGEEQICKEEPKVKDWCQALVAGGAECTPETLKGIDDTITDEEIKTGMADAEEVMKKYRDTPDWEKFKFQNNNLGNKLQGLLYVKVDKRNCRLRITDNYVTIYNGKRVEDSNPAGTNPFVKNEMGELLWEGCKNSGDLVATTEAEFPKNPDQIQHLARHSAGTEISFWYLDPAVKSNVEGCTDSFDVWLDGKPLKQGLSPSEVELKRDKVLSWSWKHQADNETPLAQQATGEAFHMVWNRKCTGENAEKESKDGVSCALILVGPPAPPAAEEAAG